jgi:hypothetical protein
MKKIMISIMSIGVTGMLLTGCSSNTTKNVSNANKTVKTTTKTNSSTSQPKKNSLFQTSLKLPNGDVVKPNKTVKWKDLSIQLIVTSLPSQMSSPDKYIGIIGNHSTIINHEKVSLSGGKADLVLIKRTSPAASQTTKETYEYWVIAYGSQYAYAIDATIIGNKDKAKNEVMTLLKTWKVPQ